MMTRRERIGKEQVIRKLRENGYPTYADLFELFELNLTKDPDVIGYMVPDQGKITINENLNIEQVSLIVRHEILHEYLSHKKRTEKIGGKMDQISNIAADYDISNVGYTDEDKISARQIELGDKVLTGLVTDFDHPDWVDKSFEEMYELLKKESPESSKQPQIGDRGSKNIQDAEEIERRAQAIKDSAEDQLSEDQPPSSGQSQDGDSGDDSQDGSESEKDEGTDDSSNSGSGGGGSDSDENPDGENSGDKTDSNKNKKRNKYDDEEYSKMSSEEKKKERARRRREAAKKLKEEADKIIDEIKDVLDDPQTSTKGGPGSSSGDKKVFDTPEEQIKDSERIKEIKRLLSDLVTQEKALDESRVAVSRDRVARAAKDASRYRSSPLTKFTESLNKFIRDSIARGRNDSWAHINKKYVNSGLLKPGQSYSSRGNIPLINVYFDRSGSWDKSKTAKGQEAIATLNRYVTRGEIKLKLYYFAEKVMDVDINGGRTNGQPILDHIQQTKPNNVIILTDSDIRDCRDPVQVPGAVWFLFYQGRSQNLVDHLSGRQLTREFEVE